MNRGHVLCALLPLLLAVSDTPPPAPTAPAENQLEGMCRTLATRIGEEIHAGALLVDWLGSGLIIGSGD